MIARTVAASGKPEIELIGDAIATSCILFNARPFEQLAELG